MPSKEVNIDFILEAVNKLVHTACDPDTPLDSVEVQTDFNDLCGILEAIATDTP